MLAYCKGSWTLGTGCGICPRCYRAMKEDLETIKNYDAVEKPKHYNSHPSGIECIQITEHMGFCIGNAMKYLWRADLKNGVEDLKKAIWYINREIANRSQEKL